MYTRRNVTESTIIVNDSIEGETIEQKIDRIVNNGEPIKDGAPIIYTDRAEGILPEYDIRTDRSEIAVEAMDYAARSNTKKRQASLEAMNKKLNPEGKGADAPSGNPSL